MVAITFDDGVDPAMTPKVLDVLKQYNARATFFLIGERAHLYPEIVARIAAEGHAIGNHSYYHKWNFPMQSTQRMVEEIALCSEAIEKITGTEVRLFRSPFGVTNPMVGKAIRKSGLKSIGWSIRSLDTIGQPTDKVKQRVIKRMRAGEIVLLHDNRVGADRLLEGILEEMGRMRLRSVTVDEWFRE